MAQPRCALADRPCPETADATKPCFCPAWVDAAPEVVRDGSGRLVGEEIYRGCLLRRLLLYMVSVTASAGQAAKSADVCREEVPKQMASAVSQLFGLAHALVLPLVTQPEPTPELAGGAQALIHAGEAGVTEA